MKKRFKEILLQILPMTERQLKDYLYIELEKYYETNKIRYEDGYICVEGDLQIGMVAHMDVSGVTPPSIESIIYNDTYIKAMNNVTGGDDRCGVAMVLSLLEDGYRPCIIFTEGEEIGCVGANKFVKDYEEIGAKYLIQVDRKSDNTGKDNVVFYDCGNEDFQDYVLKFGFIEQHGSFSDISVLCKEYDVAGVNIGCGYFNEHTNNEYIDMSIMDRVYTKICSMLDEGEVAKYYDLQDYYANWTNNKGTSHTGFYDDNEGNNASMICVNGEWKTITEYYEEFYNDKYSEKSKHELDSCVVF